VTRKISAVLANLGGIDQQARHWQPMTEETRQQVSGEFVKEREMPVCP
jgi:hypothetical protein